MKRPRFTCADCGDKGYMVAPDHSRYDCPFCLPAPAGSATCLLAKIASLLSDHARNNEFAPSRVLATTRKRLYDVTVVQWGTASNIPFATLAGSQFLPTSGVCAAVVNQVAPGTLWTQRVGRSIRCHTLRMYGEVMAIQSPANLSSNELVVVGTLKMYVWWQKKPAQPSVMPPWATLFNVGSPLINSNFAIQNVDSFEMYELLYEHTVVLSGCYMEASAAPTYMIDFSKNNIPFDFTVPLGDRITKWTAADSTGYYQNMTDGALLVYVAFNPFETGIANVPYLALGTRLEFSCDTFHP